jgi:azurin
LYIQDNVVHWLVKQEGKSYQLRSGRNLPSDQFTIQASLLDGGDMALKINGNTVATGKAGGLFTSELAPDRVRIGHDNMGENQVGDYANWFNFKGRLSGRDSYLSLRKPGDQGFEGLADKNAGEEPSPSSGTVTVKMGVIQHEMKFDKPTFTVKAGQQVTIDFENKDFMQHNMVVGQRGSLETIGKAADELARDPKGADMNYVPKIPEVIAATQLVNPEASESLVFKAPDTPGEYPYICTVPGHWRIMNGVMIVE